MLIVDAQIHLWNAGNPTSPWHRQIPAYLAEDALKEMDAGGVDAAILTPHTPWDPNANELSHGGRARASRPVRDPRQLPPRQAESRALVDTWKQRPGMPDAASPSSGRTRAHGRRTAPSTGCGRSRAGRPADRDDGGELSAEGRRGRPAAPEPQADPRSPRSPEGDTSPSERWANLADVLALAKYPNVAMKATGAPSYSDQPYPATSTTLCTASTTPSAPRAGSGAPTSRACRCPWRQCVTLFTEELPWLKGADLGAGHGPGCL